MSREERPLVHCRFCGTTARAKIQWRGSRYISRLLWLSLIFPGPLYNYWQWKGRKSVCSVCGSEYITLAKDPDSTFSMEKMQQMQAEEPFLAKPPKPQDPSQF